MKDHESQYLEKAAQGDMAALGRLMEKYRERLKKMISSRLDPRVCSRIDESDVIQEVHLEIAKRISDYAQNPEMPIYDWMRFLAKQKMAEIVRRHILAQARDVRREQRSQRIEVGDTSRALVGFLLGSVESPSALIGKAEIKQLVIEAIELLNPLDREVLVLRHVEQLSTIEIAERLSISSNTCRQRHIRALRRLRELLQKYHLEWSDSK